MAGTALAVMGGEDVWPVHDRVAVVARLGIDLAEVGWAFLHAVVDCATGRAMVMPAKEGGVAVFAFASAIEGRTFAGAGA